MYKEISIAFLLTVFVVGLGFEPLGMIRFEEPVMAGDELAIHVNAINDGEDDLDDVRISVFIHGLDIFVRGNRFNLDDNEKQGRFLFVDIPEDAQPDIYPVKITVRNDDFKSVRYSYVEVI